MERFRRSRFDATAPDALPALCAELAAFLSARLENREFHEEVYSVVSELESVGHDLWSQDESDDFQIWGPDYRDPQPRMGLVITFSRPDKVTVEPVRS